MIDTETVRRLALALPEATEASHFNNRSFKVNKKIFATLNAIEKRATVKLSAIDQDIFCTFDKAVVYPVPNKWGKQGWMHINLQAVNDDMFIDILKTAYKTVAPIKLGGLVSFE
ncbi:hypothetical protein A0256_16165 [Mucilaginibacter sp. PAMC 26640]|nr:hypothetical protein A0256_16165 [Mucilaginibacter sp. PAMC 26640]